jgi:UDP-2,3-diacylglucosamine hydrolase
MTTFFISDLHLSAERPAITQRFFDFLENTVSIQDTLYILGDFFEFFIGLDTLDAHDQNVIETLARYTARGLALYLMPGNRDFLIDSAFAETTGCHLLPDPCLILLYGEPTLLCHGDHLCTHDRGYQRFRAFVRHPITRKIFLNFPLGLRHKIAKWIRNKSQNQNQNQNTVYRDIPRQAIIDLFNQPEHLSAKRLIHGHIHKPGVFTHIIGDKQCQRIVLGEWQENTTHETVLIINPVHFTFT